MSESSNTIFGDSLALAAVDSIDEEQTPDSFCMERHCEVCGLPRRVEIPWSELFCVARGVDPQQVSQSFSKWIYVKGKLCPDMRCNCHPNAILVFPMTPARAQQLIQSGMGSNLISAQQKQNIDQIHQRLSAPRK